MPTLPLNLSNQIFTDAGLDMLGQADAGALLTISKIVVGDGSATVEEDIFPLLELINEKAEVVITRLTDLGNGKMVVSGVLNEWDLEGDPFQLRELGIMAHTSLAGGGTESTFLARSRIRTIGVTPTPRPSFTTSQPKLPVLLGKPVAGRDKKTGFSLTTVDTLYCASNVFANEPDTVTPGGVNQRAFDITVEIDRATNVTVVIGDSSTVDCQNIPPDATVGPGVYDKRAGNIFYFKRLIQGSGIELTDLGDGGIVIGTAALLNNLDLYVPLDNPDCPDPSLAFATIQAAHDYLLGFTIPTNRQATIHVYSGTFNVAAPGIVFSHPNSRQINLIGKPRVDKGGISSIHYVDATHKGVTMASTSGLSVSQRIWLANCAPGWAGGCIITALSPTLVTASVLNRSTRPVYNTNDTGASRRLSYLPTVVQFTGTPTSGQYLLSCPYGIGSISNFCFVGGWYCLAINDGSLFDIMCMGSRRGLSVGSGFVGLNGECVFTDCDFGITGGGEVAAFDQTYINACTQGIAPNGVPYVIGSIQPGMDATVVYLSHCQFGILAAAGASFSGGSIWYEGCDYGMSAQQLSTIVIGASGYISIPQLNFLDLIAQGMSYIQYTKNGGATPTCSPVAEVTGNQNSLIHLV